jgi:MFS transporter, YNFM family, putative membrane transport protein
MDNPSYFRLQITVFTLVSAAFTNIYITQPVLPVLQHEFSADMVVVSLTVSGVILGIACSNLPFGFLADRLPIHRIILLGGVCVASCGLICALSHDLWTLIAARFLQGLFIPALTTCLAAYLSKTLPLSRLNVVMGSYVSASVIGGLGGRLLGGWLHPPLHWRYAFLSAAAMVLAAAFNAFRQLPRAPAAATQAHAPQGYLSLLARADLLRIYFCAAGSFGIFSSIFNYLPFRLNGPPFNYSTELTTLLYVFYVIGIFMGPVAGTFSNRFGSGNTLLGGAIVMGTSLAFFLIPSLSAVMGGLLSACTGFFAVHAGAVGSLNRKLASGQGRANALYMLFFYIGGWGGITCTGFAFKYGGWDAVLLTCAGFLLVPLFASLAERKQR